MALSVLKDFALLGYGLLEAWSFCLFFSKGYPAVQNAAALTAGGIDVGTLSSLGVIGGTLIILFLAVRPTIKVHLVPMSLAAGLVSSVGTLFALFGGTAVGKVGLTVCGLVNAWSWISWGYVLVHYDAERVERIAIGSAVLQICVAVVVMILPAPIQAVSISALPAVASAFLSANVRLHGIEATIQETEGVDRSKAKGACYGLLCLGASIVFTYLLVSIVSKPIGQEVESGMALLTGMGCFSVALVLFLRFAPSVDGSSIYRFITAVVAFACICLALRAPLAVVEAAMICAMFLCQFLTLIYLTKLHQQGFGGVIATFGTGWLVNHICGQVGAMLGGALLTGIATTSISIDQLVAVIPAAIVLLGVIAGGRPVAEEEPLNDNVEASRQRALDEITESASLSAREAQVFAMLANGRSAPFIRDELGISINTVNTHVRHIYSKLEIGYRQDLLDLVEKRTQEIAGK